MNGNIESAPTADTTADITADTRVATAAIKSSKRISWISSAAFDPREPSQKYQKSWYTNAILLVGEKVFFQVLAIYFSQKDLISGFPNQAKNPDNFTFHNIFSYF